jgi:orotidine-5'-phosphate decarboxylase
VLSDFSLAALEDLTRLSAKHNFILFEDRKFVDIGNTVQQQYHGGAFQISEWAHVVNASILAGEGVVEALAETALAEGFPHRGNRALLVLAEMTTKGSLATGDYTKSSIEIARKHRDFVIGFVATRSLASVETDTAATEDEDFVIFTTGVNRSSKGDKLGQQYQTPASAIERGADFIIAGRGIYAAENPVASVKMYQQEGWEAYLKRINK